MLEQGAFYLSFFIFSMFGVYLLAELIHIFVKKDTEAMKKLLFYAVAIIANLAVIYGILKLPRCLWCEEHPYLYTSLFLVIFFFILLYFIKRQDKS